MAALVYLPVTIIKDPVIAIIGASGISAGFYFIPMVAFLAHNVPLTCERSNQRFLIFAFASGLFCLCTRTTEALYYSAFAVHADAPALGFAGIACIALCNQRRQGQLFPFFISALAAVLSVWTKQTLAPLIVALPLYVLLTNGYAAAKRYLGCILITGCSISILFVMFCKPGNMVFNMFLIPMRHPWQHSWSYALTELMREGYLFAGVVLLYSIVRLTRLFKGSKDIRLLLRPHPGLLCTIVAIFLGPTSLLGYVKSGGNFNTLSPSLYFLLGAMCFLMMQISSDLLRGRSKRKRNLAVILFAILLVPKMVISAGSSVRSILTEFNSLSKSRIELEYEFIKKHPGEIYFRQNPLGHLMAEGKAYHDEAHLFGRELADYPISQEHFEAYIPSNMRGLAFKADIETDYMMKYLPLFSKQTTIEELPGYYVLVKE
jgi:hypothetical protein